MEDVLVHNRIGVQGQAVPVDPNNFIDIPEKFYSDLDSLKKEITELNNARIELGRLVQVMNHLTNVCNMAEINSARIKESIIKEMGLGDGNYAIDFDRKQICIVLDSLNDKKIPRAV